MSKSLASFADLLNERGLEIKLLDISKLADDEDIPADCALLIINNPKNDFAFDTDRENDFSYVSDIEKIQGRITEQIKSVAGVAAIVKLVPPKSIPRSEGKAKRVIDNRGLTK